MKFVLDSNVVARVEADVRSLSEASGDEISAANKLLCRLNNVVPIDYINMTEFEFTWDISILKQSLLRTEAGLY